VGRKVTVNLTVKNVGNKVAIKFYEAFSWLRFLIFYSLVRFDLSIIF
jgi:hypothetical protein